MSIQATTPERLSTNSSFTNFQDCFGRFSIHLAGAILAKIYSPGTLENGSKESENRQMLSAVFNGHFRIENHQLDFDSGIMGKLKHFFIPTYHTSQIKKVDAFFREALEHSQGDSQKWILELADAFVLRYGSDRSVARTLQDFDLKLNDYRETLSYTHPQNKQQFAKWKGASQPEEIFQSFPKFVEFLEESKLLSQIKITKDTLRIIDNEPAMLVEGKWVKESEIRKRFHIEESQFYGTRFVTDSTGEVYTYLDNRLGLQKYHPYQTIGEIPISVIEEDEIDAVRKFANKFVRPEEAPLSQEKRDALNEQRPFVLQIVTSYTSRGHSNFSETILNPRHAYMRIIAGADLPEYHVKKGDVFEFGFGWKWGVIFPLEATQGLFRSPDPWEYVSCDKRFVTCAPISGEEASRGFEFALRQQRKHVRLGREISFQLTKQNCTVFDRKIGEQAGIAIPTRIELKPLLFRILPDILKQLGSAIAAYCKTGASFAQRTIRACTQESVGEGTIRSIEVIISIFSKARDALTAFILLPIRTLLGGWFGRGGDSFEEEEVKEQSLIPQSWFDLSSYHYNLPIVLQEWQEAQPSTFVVNKPIRLAIVPS